MTCARLDDQTLYALAMVDAVIDGNEFNWNALLDAAELDSLDDLIVGLVRLGKSLTLALAAANGVTPSEQVKKQRAMYLGASA